MKRKIWLTLFILVCTLYLALGILACSNDDSPSPWCGTYYSSLLNDQVYTLTITEKTLKLDDGSESASADYTISGNTITCGSMQFILAEHFNVVYQEHFWMGAFPIQKRNGFLSSVSWTPALLPEVTFDFQEDGEFTWIETYSNKYIFYSGTYSLKDGVLILNEKDGYKIENGTTTTEVTLGQLYLYIADNYSVYSNIYLRDYTQFINPSDGQNDPATPENPSVDDSNNAETTTPSPEEPPVEDDTPSQPSKPVEPDAEHQQLHQQLEIGSPCHECGLEIYLRSGESVLLYNREEDYARAEYYGETATSVFSFFSSAVREVYISENVKSIGYRAFESHSSLREVHISKNVESIESSAFSGCSALKTVLIAENSKLTTIGYAAFSGCSALTEFIIPASATGQITIGDYAFNYCNKLSSISLPENVIRVGYKAFYGTAWYNAQPDGEIAYLGHIAYKYKGTVPFDSTLSIKEGTTVIADYCFESQGFLRKITLPQSLQYIGDYAFSGCTSLLNVALPENLVSIGRYAFSECISITEITIPASLSRISYVAFYGCNSLVEVVFESPDGWVDYFNNTVDFSNPVATAQKFIKYGYYEEDDWYKKTKEEDI